MPRFGGMYGCKKCLSIAHFADQDDIRILTNSMLHADFEILYIHSDLTLIDKTLILCENEFDWVLEREDVLVAAVVYPVEHGGNRRTLARTGHAGQQDHSLIELAEFLDYRREMKAVEVGNEVVYKPGDQPEVS